jgi:hypothetical protein
MTALPLGEIGADPAQRRTSRSGSVDAEGGGPAPRPLGGGAVRTRPQRTRAALQAEGA